MTKIGEKSINQLLNAEKGTYVLILYLKRKKKIVVGRRKDSVPSMFRSGYYAYVGSAFGPGGLQSRIRRHLIQDKKLLWHIDYLRKETVPVEVWLSGHEMRGEKTWAGSMIIMKGSKPIENFGNTDDRKSKTHLCLFKEYPSINVFRRLVIKEIPNHAPIKRLQLIPHNTQRKEIEQ